MSSYTTDHNYLSRYASTKPFGSSNNTTLLSVLILKKIIIPLALVGYEIVIANEARTISYPTRARGIIVKYIPMVFHIKSFKCRR